MIFLRLRYIWANGTMPKSEAEKVFLLHPDKVASVLRPIGKDKKTMKIWYQHYQEWGKYHYFDIKKTGNIRIQVRPFSHTKPLHKQIEDALSTLRLCVMHYRIIINTMKYIWRFSLKNEIDVVATKKKFS